MIFLASLSNLGAATGLFIGFVAFFFILTIFIYVYSALALSAIAKRTNTPNAWFAWVPYLNVYLTSQIADEAGWPVLLVLVALFLGIIYSIYTNVIIGAIILVSMLLFLIFNFFWWWRICVIRNRPGWWSLVTILPIIGWFWGFIMLWILAWGRR